MGPLVERIPPGRRDFHILKPYNVWNLRRQVLELSRRVNLWKWWWLKCKADYQKVQWYVVHFFFVDAGFLLLLFLSISVDLCWFLLIFVLVLAIPQTWGVVSRKRVGDINPTSIGGKRTFDSILTSLKGFFSRKWSSFTFVGRNGYCWWRESCTSWYGDYTIFNRVFIDNRRLAGFLPSIVPPQNRIISVMLLLLGPRNKEWPRSLSSKIIFAKHFGRGRHYPGIPTKLSPLKIWLFGDFSFGEKSLIVGFWCFFVLTDLGGVTLALDSLEVAFSNGDPGALLSALQELASTGTCQELKQDDFARRAGELLAASSGEKLKRENGKMGVLEREIWKRFSRALAKQPERTKEFVQNGLPEPMLAMLQRHRMTRVVREMTSKSSSEPMDSTSLDKGSHVKRAEELPRSLRPSPMRDTTLSMPPYPMPSKVPTKAVTPYQLSSKNEAELSQAVLELPWSGNEQWERRWEQVPCQKLLGEGVILSYL